MLIGKDWKVESDSLNVVVYRRHAVRATDKKPAHDNWVAEANYATIGGALTYLVDNGVRETGLKDYKSIVERQVELYKLIKEIK